MTNRNVSLDGSRVFRSLDGTRVVVVLAGGTLAEIVPSVDDKVCGQNAKSGACCTRKTGHKGSHVACEPVFADPDEETILVGADVLDVWSDSSERGE